MRGKVCVHFRKQSANRITPAYAGKRGILDTNAKLFQDHPRLCGEKPNVAAITSAFRGSPPPMRGKDGFPLLEALALGITPAYAGKSTPIGM